MARYGSYVDLATLKTALGETGTSQDTRLRTIIEQVSRQIDNHVGGRFFGVETATRTFTPRRSDELLIDDLLSITTLKTDEDSDYDYDYTWTTDDYLLLPANSYPKYKLRVKDLGDYSFPVGQDESVQIAGQWGYGDGESATPYAADTTTAEELDATETAVDVTSGTNIQAGHTLLVESEQMYVQSKSTNTLTVVRGVNGTTAATHATARQVYIYRYPAPVVWACQRLAARMRRLDDAPFGVTGSAEMGVQYVVARNDPVVLDWLAPYVLHGVG